jgi:hypothetical protein
VAYIDPESLLVLFTVEHLINFILTSTLAGMPLLATLLRLLGAKICQNVIFGITFDSAIALATDREWTVPCFQAGEWLFDCLCLNPIHIAITKENGLPKAGEVALGGRGQPYLG